jgi:hypothetical protein
MHDVQRTVSTLNTFFCPPGDKVEHVKLRKLLLRIEYLKIIEGFRQLTARKKSRKKFLN